VSDPSVEERIGRVNRNEEKDPPSEQKTCARQTKETNERMNRDDLSIEGEKEADQRRPKNKVIPRTGRPPGAD
jgi:hypothetical protein